MKITHSVNFGGKSQSLGADIDGQIIVSIGMFEPGKYVSKNSIDSRKEIWVTSGSLRINGSWYAPHTEPCVIERGAQLVVEANEVSTYFCEHGK